MGDVMCAKRMFKKNKILYEKVYNRIFDNFFIDGVKSA